MWVVCDETYEMWQGGFEDMDIPDDLKLNEQTVRQIKALRLWAMNRRRHSAGGHLLGQQAMEVSSQARAATIDRDAKMRPAGVCVDGGAMMLPTSGIPVARGDSSTLAAGMFDPNSLGPASWRGFARTL